MTSEATIDDAAHGVVKHRAPPLPSAPVQGGLSEESEAALRQLGVPRLMGYSVEFGDALVVRRLVEAGVTWQEATAMVAGQLISKLEAERAVLHAHTRGDLLVRASALLRMSQMMMLADTGERVAIFRHAAKLFGEASDYHGFYRVEIATRQQPMVGWLGSKNPNAPGVLIIGGIEGWAMDLLSLGEALTRRDLNVLLIDGPGQGETRFERKHFLDEAWHETVSEAVDYLLEKCGGKPVGVLGNSVGGNFAMHLAAKDRRLAACCNNGGLLVPIKQKERRGFFPKMEAFCGPVPEARVDTIWNGLEIDAEAMRFDCPLLIVQGGLDPLVSVADSRQMLDWAVSRDKAMHVFEDADHCIYNHAADKCGLIGDWFVSRLGGRSR